MFPKGSGLSSVQSEDSRLYAQVPVVLGKMGYKLELHVRKTDLSHKSASSPAFLQKHSTMRKQSQRKPVLRLNHVWGLVMRESEGSRAKKKQTRRASPIRGMKEKRKQRGKAKSK